MYITDAHYKTFSALFVSHEPGVSAGSLRVAIQQPGDVRTNVYNNDTGSGTPTEEMLGQGQSLQLYRPSDGATTSIPRYIGPQNTPPLASVPLSVEQTMYSGTTIHGNPGNATVALADSFVHPASFITDPIFCDKQVSVIGQTTVAGRSAWELRGDKVATTPALGRVGDGWRMWVDTATGIILRLEYFDGSDMIGWAEMRAVTVDGSGPNTGGPGSFSLPHNARTVSPAKYQSLTSHLPLPMQLLDTARHFVHAGLSLVHG